MITPFTAHMWGLPVPLLIEVLRAPRKVTLRSYEEVIDGAGRFTGQPITDEEQAMEIGCHAAIVPAAHAARSPTPGIMLDRRFEDRLFCALGAVALDLDALQDREEWSDHGNWVFPLATPYCAGTAGLPLAPFNRFPVSLASKMPATARCLGAGILDARLTGNRLKGASGNPAVPAE